MKSEQYKATARRIPLEAFNKGNLSAIDQILGPNFVEHSSPWPNHDRESIKQIASMMRTAFPDFHYEILAEVAEGDKIAYLMEASGTHKGEFMGIPATGKKATWNELHLLRLEGEKGVEHWGNVDEFAMMMQLGLIPSAGPGQAPSIGRSASQPTMAKTSNMTPPAGMGEMFAPGGRTTSYQDNKATVRRWFEEGFNHGDLAIVSQLYAPDYINHDSSSQAGQRGHEAVKNYFSTIFRAFPDCHVTIEDQIAEDDKVFTRWSFTGTHKGAFMGVAQTGKCVSITGMEIDRIVDDKMAESWVVWDLVGLMQQLGAMQAPRARQ